MKIYSKENLNIVKVASDELRSNIFGLHFEEDATVATNGHLLIRVKAPHILSGEGGDTLQSLGLPAGKPGFLIRPKLLPKLGRNMLLGVTKIDPAADEVHFSILEKKGVGVGPVIMKQIVPYDSLNVYPDYKEVVPVLDEEKAKQRGVAIHCFGLDAKYLRTLLQLHSENAANQQKPIVKIFAFTETRAHDLTTQEPYLLTSETKEGEKVVSVLMPCRV